MSTTPLWHKEGTTIDEAAMAFMSKDDVFLDRHLFRYDIRATEGVRGWADSDGRRGRGTRRRSAARFGRALPKRCICLGRSF